MLGFLAFVKKSEPNPTGVYNLGGIRCLLEIERKLRKFHLRRQNASTLNPSNTEFRSVRSSPNKRGGTIVISLRICSKPSLSFALEKSGNAIREENDESTIIGVNRELHAQRRLESFQGRPWLLPKSCPAARLAQPHVPRGQQLLDAKAPLYFYNNRATS